MQKIRRNVIGVSVFLFLNISSYGQSILKLKKPRVYYTSVFSVGTLAGGYLYANSVKGLNSSELSAISVNDLSTFDRRAANNNSIVAKTWSDISVFGTATLPGLLSLNKNVRGDFITYNTVYAQALVTTVGEVFLLKAITKKNRPFVYNPNVPDSEKLTKEARFSLPSGHTAIAATASYFFATTYSLYFPESKNKKWVWAGAAILPLVTGYLRYRAGKHFVSDIAGGYIIGAANGVVFPLLFRIGK